jgi:alkylation response protein AidB-like acyl-CoA dehydrogenase
LWPLAPLLDLPRFRAHTLDDFDGVMEASARLARERFAPHNRAADQAEPRIEDGRVLLHPGVKPALDAYAQAGFSALLADEADGGLQLPYAVALLCDAEFLAANVSTTGYALLARGVANLLGVHGNDEQRRLFRQPILEGRYLGTMCLSEPQAGSSLGDIATRAEPAGDGCYRLTGQKMWISAGEHELAENIVHLVLARIAGAAPGVKGLSLFVVPRIRVDADGRLGERNDVRLAGLNHKLGQRGIVNTVLSFGEAGDCIATLVGQPGQGLAQMFHMMNEARIGVGMGAIMQGLAGYQYALGYAKERRQGRHPEQKDPSSPAVAIIEHADVRRMLLQQKAWCEGALALALRAGLLVDERDQAVDPAQRESASLKLELLTPVVKAWSAEWCTRANDLAIQVLGGYGYTRDYPLEQYWRDNRLNPIHEGANGIQAIDLLGRKAMMADGAALRGILLEIGEATAAASLLPSLREHAAALEDACGRVRAATDAAASALARGEPRLALANASGYLNLLGHVLVAWMWLRQASLATAALPRASTGDEAFYRGKLRACAYFFRHELPAVLHHADLTLDRTTLDASADEF